MSSYIQTFLIVEFAFFFVAMYLFSVLSDNVIVIVSDASRVFPGNCSCNEVGEGKLDKFW